MTAGLIYGSEEYYLDHLAPLCSLLSIPLVVTDYHIAQFAQKFYPNLEVLFWTEREIPIKLVMNFQTIFYTTPRVLFEEVFFFAQQLTRKILRSIWVPHGNSDKGRTTSFMEALQEEERLITYGPRIEQFLREKGVTGTFLRIGNYRKKFFQMHKAFYKNLLPPELHKKTKKTLLYAPTWMDHEKNSSFLSFFPILLKTIPKDMRCIVKLHPNLYTQFPDEIEQFKTQASDAIFFLENFPPIYPILDIVDGLIWDGSSIGYDFLPFHRPMIFLNQNEYPENHPNLFLGKVQLKPSEYGDLFSTYSSLEKQALTQKSFFQVAYKQTFSPCKISKLKNKSLITN